MSKRKVVLAAAMIIGLIGAAGAVHASTYVLISVDNQTSSAVSLGGSSTTGTFVLGPVNSVAATTWSDAADSYDPWSNAQWGSLTYGSCTIHWAVWVYFGIVDTDVYESGPPGCNATVDWTFYFGGEGYAGLTLTIN